VSWSDSGAEAVAGVGSTVSGAAVVTGVGGDGSGALVVGRAGPDGSVDVGGSEFGACSSVLVRPRYEAHDIVGLCAGPAGCCRTGSASVRAVSSIGGSLLSASGSWGSSGSGSAGCKAGSLVGKGEGSADSTAFTLAFASPAVRDVPNQLLLLTTTRPRFAVSILLGWGGSGGSG
jgi:hypothetical protein